MKNEAKREEPILQIICTIVRCCGGQFREHFNAAGILAGGHSGDQLEAAGEVLHRSETEAGGDLSEVEFILPDELFSGGNFQRIEIVDDTAAGTFMERLLQLSSANKIVPADLTDGKVLIQMLFQIGGDLIHPGLSVAGLLF